MGITIGAGRRQRDWSKIAFAAAESAVQAIVLGPDGFSGAISAFFRTIENLRGEDDVELRATNLIIDTLAYAIASTIAQSHLVRVPSKSEVRALVEQYISRLANLSEQEAISLDPEHLSTPPNLSPFRDAASRIAHDLRHYTPLESGADIEARFQTALTEGLNRIRARQPAYFGPVLDVLTGPDSVAESRTRACREYRARLIHRFEDAPLFGEEGDHSVVLGQVYQPLRVFWIESEEDEVIDPPAGDQLVPGDKQVYVAMLHSAVHEWLAHDDSQDRIRFISGGPGSGKSTFARYLAADLALQPKWRLLFIPMQRLRGPGTLEARVDAYFRLHADEPFGVDDSPAAMIGRDVHKDWLLIFDGLDELAKEGAGSESAAQDFASELSDMRARLSNVAAVR